MFTGIITGIGHIKRIENLGDSIQHGKRLHIQAPSGYLDDVGLGDSIALGGACMTVTQFDAATSAFAIEVSAESLHKTTGLENLGRINLEKALRAQDRLGGHIVSGHVDGVGTVTHFENVGESWELRIRCPAALAPFFADKGSATIDGVSLTTNRVRDPVLERHPAQAQADASCDCEISINLIPHTLTHTTLGDLKVGSLVNVEIDLLARYVERMLSASQGGSQSL